MCIPPESERNYKLHFRFLFRALWAGISVTDLRVFSNGQFFYHDVGGHRNLRSAAYRYWFNFNYISPAILILLGSMVYRQAVVWKFRLACKTLSYRVYLWAGIAVIIAGRRLYGNTYLSSILIQPFLSYLHLITVYLGSAPANSFYFHFIFTPCSCYIDRLGLSINPFVSLSLSLYIICS